MSKLTMSDKVIGGSAIVLLIFSFLPWYTFSVGFASGNRNGWHYFLFGVIPVILAIAVAAVVGLQRFSEVKLPDLPIPWAQALLAASGLAALLILIRLLITDKVGNSIIHLTGSRSYGLYISMLAAIGLVAGAFLKMQDPTESAGPPPSA